MKKTAECFFFISKAEINLCCFLKLLGISFFLKKYRFIQYSEMMYESGIFFFLLGQFITYHWPFCFLPVIAQTMNYVKVPYIRKMSRIKYGSRIVTRPRGFQLQVSGNGVC